MSDRGDAEFLADIKEAIRRIDSYVADLTYDAYLVDTKTQDAVVRNLEIIGEAVKNVSQELKWNYPSIFSIFRGCGRCPHRATPGTVGDRPEPPSF
jgi:uncharacterized protein with HEPN domain